MGANIALKPDVIQWAIQRSGLPEEKIYKKFPKLKNDFPSLTLKQLKDFANYVRAPFVDLLLGIIPPDAELPIPDFRTQGDKPIQKPSQNLLDIIWIMRKRQEWMRDYLLSQQAQPLSFIGSLRNIKNPMNAAVKIREILGIEADWKQDAPQSNNPLKYFREKMEDIGVMVFLESGLNSKQQFDPEEFRGFVLNDNIAPFLFVNAADSKTAQLFTIVHEFVHLCKGDGGLIDMDNEKTTESFFNQTAAEILLPEKQFITKWNQDVNIRDKFNENVNSIAKYYGVSPLVIARRAKDCLLITKDEYWDFYNNQVNINYNQKKSSGGDFYKNKRYQLSSNFSYSVVIAEKYGQITFREAFSLLGLSSSTFDKFSNCITGGIQ